VALCTLASQMAFAQGTVVFQNIAPGFNDPVLYGDGVTKVSGAGYTVELLAGPTASSMAPIATTLLGTTSAGYFLGGVQTISTVAGGGVADILIEVYKTSAGSFAAAQAMGGLNNWLWSNGGSPFTVVTGDPNATPPGLPAILTGLGPLIFESPEPSAFAVAVLAIASVLIFRRRPHKPSCTRTWFNGTPPRESTHAGRRFYCCALPNSQAIGKMKTPERHGTV
jgi:hypothetical protein